MNNYPPGVTDNDPYFDMPNVHEDEDEGEEENPCMVLVDLGEHCGKPISRIAIEPYTPGRFKTECCEECFVSFMREGYIDGGKAA